MATTADEYTINAVQAADMLGVHPSTISRRIERGDMPGEIEGEGKGRNVRVPAIAVLRVLAHKQAVREAYNAAAVDFSGDVNDVIEQAINLRSLWHEVNGFDSDESERGDAMERFDEISDALDELADRVQSAQASKRLMEEVFI